MERAGQIESNGGAHSTNLTQHLMTAACRARRRRRWRRRLRCARRR
eukprot:COSAG01_NODE_13735_length_1542_cov_6.726958_1_plen_45_part_10